ncbi:hypothetical protein EZS27_002421 [termite gut metagenome]|uniref:DUF5119 domain-containing protein n=1 Tax=termite gut metagenome TaxID=433724 RepID=A0A5J4SYA2_9ZZZZ
MKKTVSSTLRSLCLIINISLGLSSCIEVPLYDTEHPDYGIITTLTTDWSNRTDGVSIPAAYQVRIGEDYNELLRGETNSIDYSFSSGVYRIRAYNPADRIVVGDMEASVVATDTDGFVESQPGWFFTASEEVFISNDRDESITIVMQQQVRQLDLVFTFVSARANKLTSIDAILGGVAGSLDIDYGVVTGTPVSVKPEFVKQSEGVYRATMRLLGVTGDTQMLWVRLSFGGLWEAPVVTDLSLRLADFNADKKTPLLLSTQLVEVQTELGFTVSFGEWKVGEEIEVVVR